LVSGATTVVSPIGSSACFSARSPRDSTPSSFVMRIRGCDRLAALLVEVAPFGPGALAGHVGLVVGALGGRSSIAGVVGHRAVRS
jgi:hypothetical protein